MIKVCPNCNEEFETNMKIKKFCTNQCKVYYHNMKKNLIEIKCHYCMADFKRPKHQINNINFCSRGCVSKYDSSKNSLIKICEFCKKDYKIPKSRNDKSKFCSMSCRAKVYSKIINKNKNNQITVECLSCNNSITRRASSVREHNFCNYECMSKYYSESKMFSGKNSGTWNGGKKTYYGENWLSQRRRARKRDNYVCQKCGITEDEYGQELSVHHKVPFIMFDNYIEANKLDNLMCVCEPCHRKIHSGNNHPSKFKETYKNSVDDIV